MHMFYMFIVSILLTVAIKGNEEIKLSSDKLVVCYLGAWANYRQGDGKFVIENIDATLCTHAVYGFAKLDETSNQIASSDPWLDFNLNGYASFVGLKATNPELKTLLAIGGWNEGSTKYSEMAANETSRGIFVQSAVNYISTNEFDGLDLDWEYPANRGGLPEDRENFALLITELRKEFDKYDLLLTAAIGVGVDVLNTAYDFSTMCRDLDFINLKTYDLQGTLDNETGHHASLYTHPNLGDVGNSLTQSLDVVLALGGCPSKMVLGMGMFAKTYTLKNPTETDIGSPTVGTGTAGQFTGEEGMLGYNEICVLEGYEEDRDNYTMAPWAYKGDQWLCYDDVESIGVKSEWALVRGLAGGMIWSIETDDFRGNCGGGVYPLLTEINRVVKTEKTTANTGDATTSTTNTASSIKTIATTPEVATDSGDTTVPGTTTTSKPISAAERKVVCYLGSWANYRQGDGKFVIEDIDATLCTHAIYGFAKLDETTNQIAASDPWLDFNLNGYARFVGLKATNPELKTLLAIGGWNEGSTKYSEMVASKTSRGIFVQSAVNYIRSNMFDGLDLDWEYPANRGGLPEDRENFAFLITELRQEFDKYNLLLTAAIGVGVDVLNTAYDFSIMCRDLDFINLMTYDLHGAWDNVTGHHTSLYTHPNLGDIGNSLTESLDVVMALGGCPSKMVLGMGMYAKTYTLKNPTETDIGSPTIGTGTAGQFTNEKGMLGYNEICLLDGYEEDRDNYTMAPWAFKGDQWLCYDDVESVGVKSEWALVRGLAGGMIWSIETDDFRGSCGGGVYPLLTEINRVVKTGKTTATTGDATTATTNTASSIKTIATTPEVTTDSGDTSVPGTTTNRKPISAAERKVVCYLGSWANYRQGDGKFVIEDIDATLCTHVIYGFAKLDETTNQIAASDPWLDFDLNGYARFVGLKAKNPELKTLLAIGGWNEGSTKYSEMVASKTSRGIFVQSAVSYIRKNEFDGLDLDWEYPANRGGLPDDRNNFALLITELRQEFDKYDLLLTAAIGVGVDVLNTAYDFSIMCRDLDFINLMTYDLHGAWDNVTGHHTSLYTHPNLGDIGNSLTQSLDVVMALGGCPSKMVLGMGMYAKTYTLKNPTETDIGSPTVGTGTAGQFTGEEGMLGYNEICLLDGYEVDRDNYTMAPWAYKGNQWLCYDDVESIGLKSDWALVRGLAGGMIWSIETDDFRGNCGGGVYPLLTEINRVVKTEKTTANTGDATTSTTNTASSIKTIATTPEVATDSGDTTVPGTTTTSKPISAAERKVVCYLGSWANYRQGDGKFVIEDIDATLCTHAIYGFAKLDETTNQIAASDPWLDFDLNGYARFVGLKAKNPELKTLLAIGGWNEGSTKYSEMVASKTSRGIFVQSAVNYIRSNKFDGLDLDWEYPANRGGLPEDRENFAFLITELRQEFDKYDLLLTAAIGVGVDVLNTAYDFSIMCRDLDFINLMTYDLHGAWDNVTGHHTCLYTHPNLGDIGNSLTESLDVVMALGGCPSKMVLGMGMYAKTYTLKNPTETDIGSPTIGTGTAGQFTNEKGMLGYNELCLLEGYEEDRDNYTMAPWAFKGDQWLCYDDVESIGVKSEWALVRGLAGGMIWSIETDDFRGNCGGGVYPLLTEINRVVKTEKATATTGVATTSTTALSTTATTTPPVIETTSTTTTTKTPNTGDPTSTKKTTIPITATPIAPMTTSTTTATTTTAIMTHRPTTMPRTTTDAVTTTDGVGHVLPSVLLLLAQCFLVMRYVR